MNCHMNSEIRRNEHDDTNGDGNSNVCHCGRLSERVFMAFHDLILKIGGWFVVVIA
jgi:hypothetical protein